MLQTSVSAGVAEIMSPQTRARAMFCLPGILDGSSISGLHEDVVLTSWLILVMRTTEDEQLQCVWRYNTHDASSNTGHILKEDLASLRQRTISEQLSVVSAQLTKIRHEGLQRATPFATISIDLPVSVSLESRSTSINVQRTDENVEIWLEDDPACPQHFLSSYLAATLSHYASQCTSEPQTMICDLTRPTAVDLDHIWSWNGTLPPLYKEFMHDRISTTALSHPTSTAIDAWDGTLSYADIDRYSLHTAALLQQFGIAVHDVVPICFEKSRWTIVAVLAAMRVGATFVLMDPSLPLARLQNMAIQVGAKMMISSQKQHEFAKTIMPEAKVLVVDQDLYTSQPLLTPREVEIPTSAIMYLIFTSGSTGQPKGVKISHETYTSSAIPRAATVGYTVQSRVLDFASYAFDVSIDSMLLTLAAGGCLCIPSDEDRMNDINGIMRRMKITYAGLTPSVARILEPDVINALEGLGLGGEAVSARDANFWGQSARIIIGYGPCECTIGCTINGDAATGRNYISIGQGNGAAIWIVDPEDHDILMPFGAVGELLVEGPIVGQGYLNDPEKTASVFIENPKWLIEGHAEHAGRTGRLYKTGDLGRYDPDGDGGIVFVGRKDTQVKLRGQRVELGEIESQLRARLPQEVDVVAEVIKLGTQSSLIAFISPEKNKKHGTIDITLVELTAELSQALSRANDELAKVLPVYMIPTTYIPISAAPILISGKVDRKQLRQFATTVDLQQLDLDTTKQEHRDLNDVESRLASAWANVLSLDIAAISLDSNFFMLGGDSVLAMRLIPHCRSQGLLLSVADIFKYPTLSSMAETAQVTSEVQQAEFMPFMLLDDDVDAVKAEAARSCNVDLDNIMDIFDCTPIQQSEITFSLKSTQPYVAQRIARIPSQISIEVWKAAWTKVYESHAMLRTRVVQLGDKHFSQVVLRDTIRWYHSEDLQRYLQDDRKDSMTLGQPLARFAIVTSKEHSYMVWTIHHVIYDGWSEPLILEDLSHALAGQSLSTPTPMQSFVQFLRLTGDDAMKTFWRDELKGAVGPQFPRLPHRDYVPTQDSIVERSIRLASRAGSFTTATLIRAAWSLVVYHYTGNTDVVFGETLSGRDISLPGVESIIGPLIATVPVRVPLRLTDTVETLLHNLQRSASNRAPYQHMGMQNIRLASSDAQIACETGTGMVIQPSPDETTHAAGFESIDVVRESLKFNPYPLMLACGLQTDGFRVCAGFDSSLIDKVQMERMLTQLEATCCRMLADPRVLLGDVSILDDIELDRIWAYNKLAPLRIEQSNGILDTNDITPGSAYPPATVSWICTLHNPSLLVPIGCEGELWLESNLLPDASCTTPAFLGVGSVSHPGRSGRMMPTGDIVRRELDGCLTFIGQRGHQTLIKGHNVNLSELNSHLSRYLPSEPHHAVLAVKDSQSQELRILVYVDIDQPEQPTLQLFESDYQLQADSDHSIKLHGQLSQRLSASLRAFDDFCRASLPAFMVPSFYVTGLGLLPDINTKDIPQLAERLSTVPSTILSHIKERLTESWEHERRKVLLTTEQAVLQQHWANLLGLDRARIGLDDSFFRLGGDSVLAMKLVAALRKDNFVLAITNVFKHMRLRSMAGSMKARPVTVEDVWHYEPFSAIKAGDPASFIVEVVKPQLANPELTVSDAYPTTTTQDLDVYATINAPRTSIQYTALYLDGQLEADRFEQAWLTLVKQHAILRTVFIKHDHSYHQVVLEQLVIPLSTLHTTDPIERAAAEICAADANDGFQLGSSFVKAFLLQGEKQQTCFILGLSHAQYDGVSLPLLLQDLTALYQGMAQPTTSSFGSYIAQTQNISQRQSATQYWRGLLSNSSITLLKDLSATPIGKAVFRSCELDLSQQWEEFTVSNILTAAWALVLARHLEQNDVTFGAVTSGRGNISFKNVDTVCGPCYQFAPVRVIFHSGWTAVDVLSCVQQQSLKSATHDYLGFKTIAEGCTSWASDSVFGSIVHHQEADDGENMTFAGLAGRADVIKPDGDAPSPLKVVTYVEHGQTHIGVVGDESDTHLVSSLLAQLTDAFHEIANRDSKHELIKTPSEPDKTDSPLAID